MNDAQKRLLERYFTSKLGEGWQQGPFSSLDGMQALEASWPLNDLFRPHLSIITSLPYVPRLEKEADAAIESLVFGRAWSNVDPPPNVWRVLLERQIQAQMIMTANWAQGNSRCVPIPAGLSPDAWLGAVVLFLHYAMKLPFPVSDRAAHSWPASLEPSSLLRH